MQLDMVLLTWPREFSATVQTSLILKEGTILSQGYCSFISTKLYDFAENDDCLHHAVHERLGELLRVLKTIISKHQSLNSVDILSTAGTVIATVKGELWSPMNTRMGNSQLSTWTYQVETTPPLMVCFLSLFILHPPLTVLSIGHPLFFQSYYVLSLSLSLSSQDVLVTTNQGKFFFFVKLQRDSPLREVIWARRMFQTPHRE